MFERQFGLRENPFVAGHQSRFVYPSREHQEALAHLRFGIENREPFVLITGEVGTGKTTALYDVLAEYESRAVVALITNSSLTRDELFEEICLRFGLPTAGALTKPQALAALERFLRQTRASGRHAILILDEAQNLERALLEEIRQLSNLEDDGNNMLQLFLVGQPELEEKLARPELRQLRQRITVFYRLNPLSAEDTERYIHHRITVAGGHAISLFPADACREVYALTHGIPREINTVAGQAMLNAFVEDSPAVLPAHVRIVERDSEFQSVLRGGEGSARISTLEAPAPGAEAAPHVRAAETHAPSPAASDAPPPWPGPSPHGPPPLHPAETIATPHAASASPPLPPASSEQGPPALLPAEAIAAPHAAGAGPTADAAANTGPAAQARPRRAGSVAPAGTAEAWGSWLSSLAQLPSVLDETEAGTGEASVAEPTESPTHVHAAEEPVSPPAPLVAAARSETVAPASSIPSAKPASPVDAPAAVSPPRAEAAPRLVAAAAASTPVRAEPPARTEAAPPASAPEYAEAQVRAETISPASAPEYAEAPVRAETAPPAADRAESAASGWARLREEMAARTETAMAARNAPPAGSAEPADDTAGTGADAGAAHARTPRRLEFVVEEPAAEAPNTMRLMIAAGVIAVVAISAVLGIRTWRGAATRAQSETVSAVPSATAPPPAPASPATSPGPSGSVTPAGTETDPTVTPTPRSSRMQASTGPQSATTNTSGSSATGQPAASAGPAPGSTASGAPQTTRASAAPAAGTTLTPPGAAGGAAAGAAVGGAATSGTATGGTAGGAATGNAPARTAAAQRFGVAVGTYLNEERADQERAKLVASTNLPARVVTVTEDDVAMYRLVMGAFDSRQSAERMASSLIERGLVDEARVVPLSATTPSKP